VSALTACPIHKPGRAYWQRLKLTFLVCYGLAFIFLCTVVFGNFLLNSVIVSGILAIAIAIVPALGSALFWWAIIDKIRCYCGAR
jgi:cytochrome c oxidase assembly factor CtaG